MIVCDPCPLQVAVVGGGAGGVEVSLALNHRLKQERLNAGKGVAAECQVSLFTSSHILTGHIPAARRKLLRIAQVGLWTNCTVATLMCERGSVRCHVRVGNCYDSRKASSSAVTHW